MYKRIISIGVDFSAAAEFVWKKRAGKKERGKKKNDTDTSSSRICLGNELTTGKSSAIVNVAYSYTYTQKSGRCTKLFGSDGNALNRETV